MTTNFREAKIQSREALRRGLLDTASRILMSEGLEAITMRRIAQEVQASTQVLYTLFKNKEGLYEQLYIEGFERLRLELEAVQESQPADRLLNLGRAYRAFGQANPAYFAVLFSQLIPGFTPSLETMTSAYPIFEIVEKSVLDCMQSGVMAKADPARVSKVFYACIHGALSLELTGYMMPTHESPQLANDIFELTMSNALKGFSA